MKRRIAALFAVLAIAGAASVQVATANVINTTSWTCPWSASSFSGVGSATAKGFGSCVDKVGLVFTYYHNGSWTDGTWQWSTADVISGTAAGTQADGTHQVYVTGAGKGWGQVVGTACP